MIQRMHSTTRKKVRIAEQRPEERGSSLLREPPEKATAVGNSRTTRTEAQPGASVLKKEAGLKSREIT